MKLLQEKYARSGLQKFMGTDTESLYTVNLKTQPKDWLWRDKSLRYSNNEQGYRTKPWRNQDWSSSVLIFGCSMIYGVGVDDNQTVSRQLEEILKVPVINLGYGGTGIGFQWTNSIILKSEGIKPRAVIYVWPDRARQVEYLDSYNIVSYGSWNMDKIWTTHPLSKDQHNYHWAKYTTLSLTQLWDCPVIQASWYHDMAEICNCRFLNFLDKGRDLLHPGPMTTMAAAADIAHDVAKYILK